jgi:hypothetical protein
MIAGGICDGEVIILFSQPDVHAAWNVVQLLGFTYKIKGKLMGAGRSPNFVSASYFVTFIKALALLFTFL